MGYGHSLGQWVGRRCKVSFLSTTGNVSAVADFPQRNNRPANVPSAEAYCTSSSGFDHLNVVLARNVKAYSVVGPQEDIH